MTPEEILSDRVYCSIMLDYAGIKKQLLDLGKLSGSEQDTAILALLESAVIGAAMGAVSFSANVGRIEAIRNGFKRARKEIEAQK